MDLFKEFLSIFLTLFAVIDIIGSLPLIIDIKQKHGSINAASITISAAFIMILFLFIGDSFLNVMGIDVHSFAVAGSIVLFIIGLEMVLGANFFKTDPSNSAGTIVPLAFPVIAGTGTLTTILSLKAAYENWQILVAIVANLLVIFIVLKTSSIIEKALGKTGMAIMRKFFGIILLSIAIKLFSNNVGLIVP